jgi:hypothetical protein
LAAQPERPIKEITDFAGDYLAVAGTSEGSYFVVDGFTRAGGEGPTVKVFDGLTGKEVWAHRKAGKLTSANLVLDPSGKLLAFRPVDNEPHVVVEVPSGKFRGTLKGNPLALSPKMQFWLDDDNHTYGYTLRRGSDGAALVRPGLEVRTHCVRPEFSPNGRLVAWGNDDGTVFLCDIEEIQRRLTSIGLGW